MAQIEERNGAYRITVSCGRDRNGKRILKKTTYHPTSNTEKQIAKEVMAYALEFEKKVLNGDLLDGEKITLDDFIGIWKSEWAIHNLGKSTLESYEWYFNLYFLPMMGNMKLGKITALHIQRVYNDLIEKGLAPATIKRIHASINSVFKYAFRMGIVRENVCKRCEMPKQKADGELHFFTAEQSVRFLDFVSEGYKSEVRERTRVDSAGNEYSVKAYTVDREFSKQWLVYFALALYGGFRRGELVALKWRDIDFEKELLSINKAVARTKEYGQIIKDAKTAASRRTLKLPPYCFELLKEWKVEQLALSIALGTKWQGKRDKEFDENFVFIQTDSGKMISVDTPTHLFKKILKRYNEQCENEEDMLPDIRLHDIRHTQATLLLSEGVDIETVSHRLGHSKPSITMDIYGHWMEETDEKASHILDSLFKGTGAKKGVNKGNEG